MPARQPSLATSLPVYRFAVCALFALACGGGGGGDTITTPPGNEPWIQKSSLPGGGLAGAASFVAQGKIYVGTGFRNGEIWDFYTYDPAADTWQALPPFPSAPRSNAIGFAIGSYGYIGLGYNCIGGSLCTFNYFSDLWRFDPTNFSWTRMADFPGTPRAYATSFVIGDKAYVTGGIHAGDNDLWEYDPATNAWTKKANYAGRCTGGQTAFSVAGKGYVGLGSTNGLCNDFWRYDPGANSWTAIADFPGTARSNAVGYATASAGFVIGGARDPSYPNDIWAYDVASNAWSQVATTYAGKGRSQMISGVVAQRIFIGLGTTSDTGGPESRFDDFWEYKPGS